MAWLYVALRIIFWMTLIFIQFLKILHQEMHKDDFLQKTEALYFLFEVIIIVINIVTLLLYLMSYTYIAK